MGFYDLNKLEPEEVSNLYQRKVVQADSVVVASIEVKKGAVTDAHHHQSDEVVIVLRGSWRFTLPGGEVTLGPNQMLSIPSGVEHSSVALEDTSALDICTPTRFDWVSGEDSVLHHEPEQSLWAV